MAVVQALQTAYKGLSAVGKFAAKIGRKVNKAAIAVSKVSPMAP